MARRHYILEKTGCIDYLFTNGIRHPFFFRGRPIDYASVISRMEDLATGTETDLPRAAINCTIRYLDLSSGKLQAITLTKPAEANPSAGLVSIFSPLGSALLSSAEKEVVGVRILGMERKLRVLDVRR
ncbi:GreA/GreB family elongation factor [Marinobacter sp. TBZ242]|uniref:GreA/GreB family elongation factor n=1 Tax=Marinobacter azerbaijanicus TaxID=3050455 RepID=A0ABT7IIK0_9GAMM|nr:GreA/GreB family elongation factor [Marinobacter sp. TBZ242]MDL0434004.1 GreA/GreB family elongation factor [Marinobacter sp. TBZ242]